MPIDTSVNITNLNQGVNQIQLPQAGLWLVGVLSNWSHIQIPLDSSRQAIIPFFVGASIYVPRQMWVVHKRIDTNIMTIITTDSPPSVQNTVLYFSLTGPLPNSIPLEDLWGVYVELSFQNTATSTQNVSQTVTISLPPNQRVTGLYCNPSTNTVVQIQVVTGTAYPLWLFYFQTFWLKENIFPLNLASLSQITLSITYVNVPASSTAYAHIVIYLK